MDLRDALSFSSIPGLSAISTTIVWVLTADVTLRILSILPPIVSTFVLPLTRPRPRLKLERLKTTEVTRGGRTGYCVEAVLHCVGPYVVSNIDVRIEVDRVVEVHYVKRTEIDGQPSHYEDRDFRSATFQVLHIDKIRRGDRIKVGPYPHERRYRKSFFLDTAKRIRVKEEQQYAWLEIDPYREVRLVVQGEAPDGTSFIQRRPIRLEWPRRGPATGFARLRPALVTMVWLVAVPLNILVVVYTHFQLKRGWQAVFETLRKMYEES